MKKSTEKLYYTFSFKERLRMIFRPYVEVKIDKVFSSDCKTHTKMTISSFIPFKTK